MALLFSATHPILWASTFFCLMGALLLRSLPEFMTMCVGAQLWARCTVTLKKKVSPTTGQVPWNVLNTLT